MSPARVWVLNLDAEAELAHRGAITPSAALAARWGALRAALGALVPPGDLVLQGATVRCVGAVGRAWCPTPSALRQLRDAGARVEPTPAWEVLRAVNHRAFNAALGQTLPGAAYARTLEEVQRALGVGRWVCKRPFGYRGNGKRVLSQTLSPDDGRWLQASLRGGEGLQVEPWVERTEDFGLHGHLSREGALTEGEPTVQRVDGSGAWVASERSRGSLTTAESLSFLAELRRAAAALRARGYWGPFGIDAFLWRDREGARRWNPRCEVNARYSMGWAVGMGDRRPDL